MSCTNNITWVTDRRRRRRTDKRMDDTSYIPKTPSIYRSAKTFMNEGKKTTVKKRYPYNDVIRFEIAVYKKNLLNRCTVSARRYSLLEINFKIFRYQASLVSNKLSLG